MRHLACAPQLLNLEMILDAECQYRRPSLEGSYMPHMPPLSNQEMILFTQSQYTLPSQLGSVNAPHLLINGILGFSVLHWLNHSTMEHLHLRLKHMHLHFSGRKHPLKVPVGKRWKQTFESTPFLHVQ